MLSFYKVRARAQELGHPLTHLLDQVKHYHELAQIHALEEHNGLAPLKGRLHTGLTVYPGTEEAYQEWDSVRASCMAPVLHGLANSPAHMGIASMEVIWRIFEAGLAQGMDFDDPEKIDPAPILEMLQARAEALGGPPYLLGECALNRYSMMRRPSTMHFVATSYDALEVMIRIGELNEVGELQPTEINRIEAFAFFLFDRILMPHTRPLHPSYAPILARLMDKHEQALERMREECRTQAAEFLKSEVPTDAPGDALFKRLQALEAEVAEIAGLDASATRSVLRDIATDPKVWVTVAGFLGAAALPAAVTAAMGVTAFSLLGAKATKAHFDRGDALADSPWAFVYYASRDR